MKTETPRTDAKTLFADVAFGKTKEVVIADDARELERENARLLGLVKRARDIINVSPDAPPNEWPSTDEINQLVKDCDDILPNVSRQGRREGEA
jgi:hypothetical protein